MATGSAARDPQFWDELLRRPADEALPDALPGRWCVAHTKPRNEKALVLDLHSLGIISYLPLRSRSTQSRKTGRATRSIVPVFTGYVFFNADDERRRLALTTNRIANVLAVGDQHQLVRELRQIQKLLSTNSEFEWGPTLATGDWARVTGGPLLGLEGVVVRKINRFRLALNVNMLSQSVMVEVSREMLEKADRPSELAM